jgi:UDP-N-acetylmuramyl pentapeptide phosphotransferase/UDP-N-acetylglucosamine-1-phosphate transferase
VSGAIAGGTLQVAWGLTNDYVALPVIPAIAGGLICAGVGIADDLNPGGLTPRVKLLGQLAAAATTLLLLVWIADVGLGASGGLGWLVGALVVAVALLWMTALTNFANFMDGSDAMVAGVVFLILVGYVPGVADVSAATYAYAVACGASAAAFLWWNRPPAKIFMGDGGSLFLGLTAAVFGIWTALPSLTESEPTDLTDIRATRVLAAVVLVAPLWVDPVMTIAIRAFRGRSLSEAHREHLYQRMIGRGMSHGRVALVYYVYTIGCVAAVTLITHGAAAVGATIGIVLVCLGLSAVALGHRVGIALGP